MQDAWMMVDIRHDVHLLLLLLLMMMHVRYQVVIFD